MLLVGIDEAGYGPLLGPLVVSTVALRLPDEVAGLSLWDLLSGGVADRAAAAKGRFLVADSKKIFHGTDRDLRELERSSLGAVLLSAGMIPNSLEELLRAVSLEPDPHLTHRWYCHAPLPLPCRAEVAALKLAAGLLGRELAGVGAAFAAVRSVPLVEKKYNHFVQQTKNKAEVLFSQTIRLIHEVLNQSNERRVHICIDKQGGKDTYTRNLLRTFPTARLSVVREGPEESEYRLEFPNQAVQLSFCQKGEQKHLLIAWASILSKYLRELFMLQFNRFWQALAPDLAPTAGYWEDGRRFMKDIEPVLRKMNIPSTELVRQL
jgi:ribonuclease HII